MIEDIELQNEYCVRVVLQILALKRIIDTAAGPDCISQPSELEEVRSKCNDHIRAIGESDDEEVAEKAEDWLWSELNKRPDNKRIVDVRQQVLDLEDYDFEDHEDDIPNGH